MKEIEKMDVCKTAFTFVIVFAVAFAPISGFIQPVGAQNTTNDTRTFGFENEQADSGVPERLEAITDPAGSGISRNAEIERVTTEKANTGDQSYHVKETQDGNVIYSRPQKQPYDTPRTDNVSFSFYKTTYDSDGDSEPSSNDGPSMELWNEIGGSPLITATVEQEGIVVYDGSSGGTNLDPDVTENEWVNFQIYNIDPESDTYSLKWSSPSSSGTEDNISMAGDMVDGYRNTVIAVDEEAYVDDVSASESTSSPLSGRVVSCPATNPDCEDPVGVPDGTVVEAYGVNESNIDPGTAQTLEERADEIRNDIRSFDPEKTGWDADLDLTGGDGLFGDSDENYVAVHSPSDWGLSGWTDSPDLSQPMLQAPADEDFIVSVWNPESNPFIQDGVDSGLPGTTVQGDNTIVFEQLGYDGDVTNTYEVETSETYNVGGIGGEHDFARVNLPPGFYTVSAEGSSVSYVMTVGDPQDLAETITADLRSKEDSLTNRSQNIRDLMSENKVVELSTNTYTVGGERGHFSFQNIPSGVNVVAVQAYTPAAEKYQVKNPANASIQDLREVASLTEYNSSFYVTPRAQDLNVPSNGNQLKAIELSGSPFMDPGRHANKTEWLENLFQNSSFTDQIDDYLETSTDDREQIRDRLESIKDQNQQLQDRYKDLLDRQYNGSDPDTQEQIRLLRQTISELEGTLESGDPSADFQNGEASAMIPWNGDVDPDAISVTAHYPSLGVSEPVPDEFVSVDKRVGRGDVVNVANYPAREDAANVNFGVTVSGEDGETVGDTSVGVRNPNFTGSFLNLKSMSVSTLRPSSSEQVTIRPKVSEQSALIDSISADVTGPNGQDISTHSTDNGEGITFETDGVGPHSVQFEITDESGNTWSETLPMKAHDEDVNQPPSVRVRDGHTGTFAVVSDGLTDGGVETDGSSVSLTGVANSESLPNHVHFYGSEVSNNHPSTSLNVMKFSGGDTQTIRKHVSVSYHTASLPSGTIVYRAGSEPLKVGGSTAYGDITCPEESDGCTVDTYTDASGSVDLTVNTNPGIVDRAIYWVRLNSPVDIPVLTITPNLGAMTGGVPA